MKSISVLILLISSLSIRAQVNELDQLSETFAVKSFANLKEFLAIPNDAHHHEDIKKNLLWCESAFQKRGFELTKMKTETVPLLLAERAISDPNAKTVLIYLQIDGQPVDPQYWFQDNPHGAVLRESSSESGYEDIPWARLTTEKINPEWRIFARSTSDSKGAVVMFLSALDAMASRQQEPNFNIKVIMDFEEEIGSPRLPQAVQDYKEELSSDMLVIFDGPRHISNQPTLTFGARGIATVSLTLYGPLFPQHSGHYGNYCPNPAVRLAQLISSMKDESGRVLIPGFYDGITISEATKKILSQVPDDERKINLKLGIAQAEDGVADTYQEALQYPSLNVRGMSSGWVGEERRTIIPSSAIAEIDVRLVLETDGERLIDLIKDHISEQGYFVLDRKPTSRERTIHDKIIKFESENNYKAFRTSFDSDIGVWLDAALSKAFNKSPIKQRTSGGSIPISPFVNTLEIPAVTVPTVNRDNNQHSPNENIRVGNYIDGVKTMIAILQEPLQDHTTPEESIKRAAMDYLDGLYLADSSYIIRSVDPKLTKYGMWYGQEDDQWHGPDLMTYQQLVDLSASWNQDGRQVKNDSPKHVEILDVESYTATVKVTAVWGIDYLQLVKVDEVWKIMNIMWQSVRG